MHVQDNVFDLYRIKIYAPLFYNYRDWKYNATGEPMPISFYQMTGSLQQVLEKCPEVRFKKTKMLVNLRSLLVMPVLAQLIGLVDHLKEWDLVKTDLKRGAYIDLDAILDSLKKHNDNFVQALEKILESVFGDADTNELSKLDMQVMNGQIA